MQCIVVIIVASITPTYYIIYHLLIIFALDLGFRGQFLQRIGYLYLILNVLV